MTSLAALIERLERAEAGSRELDAEIGAWLEANATDDHGPRSNYHLSKQKTWMGVKGWEWRRWTTSIDSALTLVPADGYWQCERLNIEGETRGFGYATVNYEHEGLHPVPALALCIAALRARGARHD